MRLEDSKAMRQRLSQKKKDRASSMGCKKAKLFKSMLELVGAPTRSNHLKIVKTFLKTIIDALIVMIIHPVLAACQSSSSTLVGGTSEAPADRKIEEALKCVDPQL